MAKITYLRFLTAFEVHVTALDGRRSTSGAFAASP